MVGPQRNVKSKHMAPIHASYQVHSQARGPHWIAWITREGGAKPYQSVVLIGKTQAEAEARAGAWADLPSSQPRL
jgi:hypothetical protein